MVDKNAEEIRAEVISIAARGWKNPGSLSHEEIRSICASWLAQLPDKPLIEPEVVENPFDTEETT